ncbi:hypothetical protein MNB_SM-4-1526 [hydrothermal vent metagenome]|uniref:DUF2846 domain-containing protein n=1 Tax=hydrothermal vent metagenome TaxID=652676 RepID=A0A1W1BPZ2_9ZZZZ
MKKVSILLMSLLSFFMVSCSNLEVGLEEDSVFYGGGVLYIYLDDEKAIEGEYKVYINKEDTEVSLTNHFKTRFGITPGQTNIQILRGTDSASIDIFLQASNNYYIKVIKNNQDKIEISQVQRNELAVDADESALYLDEHTPEETSKTVNSEEVKATSMKDTAKKEVKRPASVETENETTISYDKNAGWE